MTQYRKKPVVIEAIQYTGGVQSGDKVIAWAIARGVGPGMRFIRDPRHVFGKDECLDILFGKDECLDIPTEEGTMTASPGDWIIKGVKGEFYPCKPDIFEMTHEEVR